jgi:hypothetical protein
VTATINGVPILRGRIHLQRVGAWCADLAVGQETELSGHAEIVFSSGGLTLSGQIVRTGVFMETAVLRVVPGAGGLPRPTKPKYWRNVPARFIAQDLLAQVGERLAPSSAPVLDRMLTAHCQTEMATASAIDALATKIGCLWRALPDGSIWTGQETWPAVKAPGPSLSQDPRAASETWGVEVPSLLPGSTLDGRRISMVEHQIATGAIRTIVWYETSDDATGMADDRKTKAIRSLVEHFTAPLDYHGQRTARIVQQRPDGSLDLFPDDPAWPQLTQVPIRYGLPGVSATVAPGGVVLFAFENGDPARPVATLWDQATIIELKFDGYVGTAMPFARATVDTAGPYPIVGGNLKVKG